MPTFWLESTSRLAPRLTFTVQPIDGMRTIEAPIRMIPYLSKIRFCVMALKLKEWRAADFAADNLRRGPLQSGRQNHGSSPLRKS